MFTVHMPTLMKSSTFWREKKLKLVSRSTNDIKILKDSILNIP